MPAPVRPCIHPRCPRLIPRGQARCDEHEAKRAAQDVASRGTATDRGYDSRWRRLRDAHLAAHPLCVGCGEPASIVDHITPHRGHDRLRLDPGNLQSVCRGCHTVKTKAEGPGYQVPRRQGPVILG